MSGGLRDAPGGRYSFGITRAGRGSAWIYPESGGFVHLDFAPGTRAEDIEAACIGALDRRARAIVARAEESPEERAWRAMAETLRRRRVALEVSLRDVAAALGVEPVDVSTWERCERCPAPWLIRAWKWSLGVWVADGGGQ